MPEEILKFFLYTTALAMLKQADGETLQTLAISFLNLQQDNDGDQQTVMKIILDVVLKEIISDESD